MDAAGVFLVEAHSQTHPRLTAISAAQLRQEVTGSRADIAANVGGKVSNHFAYPYGGYDAAVIAEVEAAGYRTGDHDQERAEHPGDAAVRAAALAWRRPRPPGLPARNRASEPCLAAPGPGWILDNADPAARPQGIGWSATTSSRPTTARV